MSTKAHSMFFKPHVQAAGCLRIFAQKGLHGCSSSKSRSWVAARLVSKYNRIYTKSSYCICSAEKMLALRIKSSYFHHICKEGSGGGMRHIGRMIIPRRICLKSYTLLAHEVSPSNYLASHHLVSCHHGQAAQPLLAATRNQLGLRVLISFRLDPRSYWFSAPSRKWKIFVNSKNKHPADTSTKNAAWLEGLKQHGITSILSDTRKCGICLTSGPFRVGIITFIEAIHGVVCI